MNALDKKENSSDNDLDLEEDSILDFKTLCNLRQGRLDNVLSEKYQYYTLVDRGQRFLLPYVISKVEFVIMYADIVGSTKMSMTLPT